MKLWKIAAIGVALFYGYTLYKQNKQMKEQLAKLQTK